MLGLDSSLGKDIVGIINNVFQAPWGGSHTCHKDEKALECSLCHSSILCYQLGCELLERLTPREEIRLVVRASDGSGGVLIDSGARRRHQPFTVIAVQRVTPDWRRSHPVKTGSAGLFYDYDVFSFYVRLKISKYN